MFCLYKVLSYIVYSVSIHEVLSYTAKLQFPSHSRLSESIPVSSPYTPKVILFSSSARRFWVIRQIYSFLLTLPRLKYSCFFVVYSAWVKGSELYGEFTVSFNTLPKWKYSCFFAVYSLSNFHSILSSFFEVLALSHPTRLWFPLEIRQKKVLSCQGWLVGS